jgi:hypothetical protein
MKTRKTRKAEKFENRVRFNWGYHDAAQAVREGWDCPEKNFGFAIGGTMGAITSIRDVLVKHFDKTYAQGWQAGYHDAQDGIYEARGRNSEEAWQLALRMGLVAE